MTNDTPRQTATFWRWEQLCLAGYDADTADLIAIKHDIDLHVAVELLEHGCSIETARSILL